jgi:uncharacterized repeat protein (TIGR01451 family)
MKCKRIVIITIATIAAILLALCSTAVDRPIWASPLYRGAFTSICNSARRVRISPYDTRADRATGAIPTATGIATEGDWPMAAVEAGEVESGPAIGPITVQTPGPIEKYSKFEVSFNITNTTATNMYFPYDENTPPGVESGTGITVDALLLPPSETGWNHAKTLPCFYYQPMKEVGTGEYVELLPVGQAEWRCRFTSEETGTWQYKIRATDAGGTAESREHGFNCSDCLGDNCKGFVKISQTDPRFFEFSNDEPFVTPLLSMEQGSPFNTLAEIRTSIPELGNHGIHFVRWFPTGEGANWFIAPYGDTIRVNWVFGDARIAFDDVDTQAGKRTSFRPYYYSMQPIPVEPGQYRFSFRGKVEGEQVMRVQVGDAFEDICSSTGTYHKANGGVCDYNQDGWYDYSLEVTNSGNQTLYVGVRGLYVSADAPAPYNTVKDGKIRIHSMQFQRFEDDRGDWSANLLTRGDPDAHTYVDQRSAARLDEIFALSERHSVYHKLTMFHKNGAILNRMQPDGTLGPYDDSNYSFYSEEGLPSRWYQRAYARYFIARWSYSTALHSLEIANETDPWNEYSYDAGLSLAQYVHSNSPRYILMSDSFWHSFPSTFWSDPDMDYADKHWYARPGSGNWDVASTTYDDSAEYVRECWRRFQEYRGWLSSPKPILRGEGGVWPAGGGWEQNPDVRLDPEGTWYHKKLWAHVGVLGTTCDGEWYPRVFVPYQEGQFPNGGYDLLEMFSAYERFIQGEPLSNALYEEIGTDLGNDQRIFLSESTGNLRAWGSRDSVNGRALLWIDNANHTWKNVVDGVVIPTASATLAIQGLPRGIYIAEWWDTRSGKVTRVEIAAYTVGSTGVLSFSIVDLAEDLAVKFIRGSALDFVSFHKVVSPRYADWGERITYSIAIQSVAGPLTNTIHFSDTLQDGLAYVPGTLTATTGIITDSAAPTLYWSGALTPTPAVTIGYGATVVATESKFIVNTAKLSEAGSEPRTARTTFIANPRLIYLPLILRDD